MPDLADFAAGPDPAHAAVAQAALDAVARLDDHVEALADAFLLGQTAADGLSIALTNFLAAQAALTQQAQQIADLEARVAALENPPAPTPDPEPAPEPPTAPFSF